MVDDDLPTWFSRKRVDERKKKKKEKEAAGEGFSAQHRFVASF